jgi:hypothetical protein
MNESLIDDLSLALTVGTAPSSLVDKGMMCSNKRISGAPVLGIFWNSAQENQD